MIAGTIASAVVRAREEKRHHRVAIVADWSEIRDVSAREGLPPIDLLKKLRENGVSAIVLGGITLEELWGERRISVLPESNSRALRDPFDTSRLSIEDPALASLLYWELSHRGISGLERPQTPKGEKGAILQRSHGTFLSLREVEAGYDVDVVEAARAMKVGVIFRVSQDPWFNPSSLPVYLEDHPLLPYAQAVLFNSDEPLGGKETSSVWTEWMKRRSVLNLLFEFKPPRSQKAFAARLPSLTHRSHTIPLNELKELRRPQELARWRRAVTERSCRFLLVHVSQDLSFEKYLEKTALLRDDLKHFGFQSALPEPHRTWQPSSTLRRAFALLSACFLLAFGPLWALWMVWHRRSISSGSTVRDFLTISGLTIGAGLLAAVIGNLPETRLQITPLRGIKAAFLWGWIGALFILFKPQEMGGFLKKSVRRFDLLIGVFAVGLLGYALLRSGNAAGEWKSSFEQALRDWLEWVLPARPRFKEFAFGHPLFFIGLYFWNKRSELALAWDPRVLIFLGMAGQASMINTFAHLHSPIELAIWRSVLGVLFGLVLGIAGSRIILKMGKNTAS